MRTERDRASLECVCQRCIGSWPFGAPSFVIVFANKFTNIYHVPAARSCRHVVGTCGTGRNLGFTKRGISLSV